MLALRSHPEVEGEHTTLARHGIVFDYGDFGFIEEDSAASQPDVALVREAQEP